MPVQHHRERRTPPIWGYCGQVRQEARCAQGVVFFIGAVESGSPTSPAFEKLAWHTATLQSLKVRRQLSPGLNATATVTQGKATWTTIYISYEGTPASIRAERPEPHARSATAALGTAPVVPLELDPLELYVDASLTLSSSHRRCRHLYRLVQDPHSGRSPSSFRVRLFLVSPLAKASPRPTQSLHWQAWPRTMRFDQSLLPSEQYNGDGWAKRSESPKYLLGLA
ncbi:hypothetical protein DFH09DRAFT_1334063 [Mycena vulgaris]|nr:hypothetical protein DFH09DRAFT_1334063 [Mycena vulgaris]